MPIVEGPYQNITGVGFPAGWELIRHHNWRGDVEDYFEEFPQSPRFFSSVFSPTFKFRFLVDTLCSGNSMGHHFLHLRRRLGPNVTGWQIRCQSKAIAADARVLPGAGGANMRSQGCSFGLYLNQEQSATRHFNDVDQRDSGGSFCGVRPWSIVDHVDGELMAGPSGGVLDLFVSSTRIWNYGNLVDTQITSRAYPRLEPLFNPDARFADSGGFEEPNRNGARQNEVLDLDIRIRRQVGRTVTP